MPTYTTFTKWQRTARAARCTTHHISPQKWEARRGRKVIGRFNLKYNTGILALPASRKRAALRESLFTLGSIRRGVSS